MKKILTLFGVAMMAVSVFATTAFAANQRYTDADAQMISRVIWGETRGIKSQTERACPVEQRETWAECCQKGICGTQGTGSTISSGINTWMEHAGTTASRAHMRIRGGETVIECYEKKKVPENCSTCLYSNGFGCGNANVKNNWIKYAFIGNGYPYFWLDQNRFHPVNLQRWSSY